MGFVSSGILCLVIPPLKKILERFRFKKQKNKKKNLRKSHTMRTSLPLPPKARQGDLANETQLPPLLPSRVLGHSTSPPPPPPPPKKTLFLN